MSIGHRYPTRSKFSIKQIPEVSQNRFSPKRKATFLFTSHCSLEMKPLEQFQDEQDPYSESSKLDNVQSTTEKSSFDHQSNAPMNSFDQSNTQQTFQHLHTNGMHAPQQSSVIHPVHFVINVDPLQQMKDFVKPFSENANDDVIKWIDSVTHFFDIIRLPGTKEALYFQYAPAFLKEYANKWWIEHKQYITDWPMFTQLLILQFGEKNEYLIEQRLNQRKQQANEPVIKYFYDMLDLCRQYDADMSNKQKIQKLIAGLRLGLYQDAIKDMYTTPSEFLTKVQHLENIQKLIELRHAESDSPVVWHDVNNASTSSQPSQFNRQIPRSIHQPYHPAAPFTSRPPGATRMSNFNQHLNVNHGNSSYSTRQRQETSARQSPIQCYNCGQMGHIARQCPTNQCLPIEDQQHIDYSKDQ